MKSYFYIKSSLRSLRSLAGKIKELAFCGAISYTRSVHRFFEGKKTTSYTRVFSSFVNPNILLNLADVKGNVSKQYLTNIMGRLFAYALKSAAKTPMYTIHT